jgi:hypothetical protein
MDTTQLAPATEVDVNEAVLQALERAPQPITIKQLRGQLTGTVRRTPEELTQLLEQEVARGRVYRFAPYRGKESRYSTRSLEQHARAMLLDALTARPQTASELLRTLGSSLRDFPKERLEGMLRELMQAGQVRELPRVAGSRASQLSTRPPQPRDYLGPVQYAYEEICAKLEPAGVSRVDILAAIRNWVEETSAAPAESPAGQEPRRAEATPQEQQAGTPPDDLGRVVLERMTQIEPAAPTGAVVSLRDLRKALEFILQDKPSFDRAILALAEEGRVELHRQQQPDSLSESEKAELVVDREGNHYVSITWRA